MGKRSRINKERLKELLTFLTEYKNISFTERKEFLSNLSDKQVDIISEILNNFLKNNIKTKSNTVSILKKLKHDIRKISSSTCSRTIKRKIFKSVKGIHILNLLLPFAIQKIINLLSGQ